MCVSAFLCVCVRESEGELVTVWRLVYSVYTVLILHMCRLVCSVCVGAGVHTVHEGVQVFGLSVSQRIKGYFSITCAAFVR